MKKINVLKIAIIICFASALVIFGFLLFDSNQSSKIEKNISKETIDLEEAQDILISIFGEDYPLLSVSYDREKTILDFDSDYYKTIASVRKTTSTVSNEDLSKIVSIKNEPFCTYEHNGICLEMLIGQYKQEDVIKAKEKLFKTGKVLTDITYGNCSEYYVYYKGYYYGFKGYGCGYEGMPLAGVYNGYKQENRIFITVVLANYSEEEDFSINYILLDGSTINSNGKTTDEIISEYGNNMEQYQLEIEKTSDGYRYINSKKIK